MKPCKTSLESFPVSLLEKSLSFGLSSRIHFPICFFSRPALTSDSNAYKYLKSALDGGRSDKLLILPGMLLDEIAKSKSIDCKCCTPLFFKWRLNNLFITKSTDGRLKFLS